MDSLQKAVATQLENIQAKTGKSLVELCQIVKDNGLEKHGQIRTYMMETFDIGYGDANLIASYVRNPNDPGFSNSEQIDVDPLISQIYSGAKEKFFPLHQKLMGEIETFGEFTIAPKKSNVSLRRKRQFVLLGPATNSRFEVGLNLKKEISDARIKPQPKGSMCNYIVVVNFLNEVDDQLVDWMRMAYEEAA